MLYFRYGTLWTGFFKELGVETVVSKPTDRGIMETGSALVVDETCLSAKIFYGHVQSLIGRCDYIFIPRISNYGRHRCMCVRFEGLYDETRNVFRGTNQKFMTCDVDVLQDKKEKDAFVGLGYQLGFSHKQAKRAYKRAKRAEQKKRRQAVNETEQLYRQEGTKILIAGHSYLIEDAFIGRTVTDYLKKSGVIAIRADLVDQSTAMKRSLELSPTCRWEPNREILGSIVMHRDKVDGIILMSAFPCGPDAMVNELLTRKMHDIPILNLVLDGQSGTAGVETRLESFVDIIRFKEGTL
ncbi:MAG: acyl-CoA dehydratase activase-related protein [Oscillospiraceae bacterium]|nr:acyl-CoA dehydratase activase-related protein [Oscillospiraceae bacterium]